MNFIRSRARGGGGVGTLPLAGICHPPDSRPLFCIFFFSFLLNASFFYNFLRPVTPNCCFFWQNVPAKSWKFQVWSYILQQRGLTSNHHWEYLRRYRLNIPTYLVPSRNFPLNSTANLYFEVKIPDWCYSLYPQLWDCIKKASIFSTFKIHVLTPFK